MIKTKDVRYGKHNGEVVWICHYLRPTVNKKPLRNIPPTKVLICPVSDLPSTKRIYYSESFFLPFGKSGNLLKKVIWPVDNTGNRNRPGNELYVFEKEKDCRKEWGFQVSDYFERMNDFWAMWLLEKLKLEKSMK